MENKQLVAKLVEAWTTGKLEGLDEVLAPSFLRHEPEIEGRTSGRDEYK
jgi:hypothetical protein